MLRTIQIDSSTIFDLEDARCDVNYFINKNNGDPSIPFFDVFQEPEKIEISFAETESLFD